MVFIVCAFGFVARQVVVCYLLVVQCICSSASLSDTLLYVWLIFCAPAVGASMMSSSSNSEACLI